MPLPKRKHSHARSSQRRSNNWKLVLPNPSACPRCRAPRLSHHVCPSCGFYANRMVIDVRARRRGGEESQADAGQE